MKNSKAITLVALVITIVILLILAGISIQAITNTGLFANARKAVEETKYANAEEKVKIAVMTSYDAGGTLNKEYLKDNLNKTEGINPKVTEVTWDLKVNVDGYEFTITEYGTVTCVGRNNQDNLPENSKDNPQDAGTEVALKDEWREETIRIIKTSDGTEIKDTKKVSTVYAVSVGNGETVPVPKGFFYVGGSMNSGVIISDNEADKYDGKIDKTTHEYTTKLKGNQFVWIPCTIDEYTKIDFGMQNMASWDRETNTAEETQISKYGGFYVGRYEAGVSTLDEETGTFKDSVTFNNNASLFNALEIQSGINGWTWQDYNFIARGKVVTDSNYLNKATGNIGLGFVKGFGLKSGAIASTVAHDSHNMIVIGTNDEDMYLAAVELVKSQGGKIIVQNGKTLAHLKLPVAGLMSDKTALEVQKDIEALDKAAKQIGCKIDEPFMSMAFLSLSVIPEIKITDKGLIDVNSFEVTDLFV